MLSPTRQLAYWVAALATVAFSNFYFTHFSDESGHWLLGNEGLIAGTAGLIYLCYTNSGDDKRPVGKLRHTIACTLAFAFVALLRSPRLPVFEWLEYAAGPQRNLVHTLVAYKIFAEVESALSGKDSELDLPLLGNTMGPAKGVPTLTALADKRYMGCIGLITATLADIVLNQVCFMAVASVLRYVFFGDAMVCINMVHLVHGHPFILPMFEVFLGAPVRVAGDALFKMVVEYLEGL